MTLDPLVRQVRLPDRRELLVSDTVGFIDRLPHALVAAFRATLEEVAEADLLLHVIDAVGPDRERQMAAVRSVLDGGRRRPTCRCRGLQQVRSARRRRARAGCSASDPGALCVSALTGEGRDELIAAMEARLALDTARVTLEFDPTTTPIASRSPHLTASAGSCATSPRDGRVSIEADVPRRCSSRFRRAKWTAVTTSRLAVAMHRRVAVAVSLVAGCCSVAVRVRAEDAPPAAAGAAARRSFPTSCSRPCRAASGAARARGRHQIARGSGCRPAICEPPSANFTAALKAGAGVLSGRSRPRLRRARAEGRQGGAAALRSRAGGEPAPTRRRSSGAGRRCSALGERDAALPSFEAALAADPSSTALRGRVDVLRFRGVQHDIDARAQGGGRPAGSTRRSAAYLAAIAASPESPFLYRELAASSGRRATWRRARARRRRRSSSIRPTPRASCSIGEIHEAQRRLREGGRGLRRGGWRSSRARRVDARIDELRERAAFAAMPAEYRAIETVAAPSRAPSSRRCSASGSTTSCDARRAATPVVMTDMRGQLGGALDPVGRRAPA